MNDADATTRRGLGQMGFSPASDPSEADLVVLITCVVQQRQTTKSQADTLRVLAEWQGGATILEELTNSDA